MSVATATGRAQTEGYEIKESDGPNPCCDPNDPGHFFINTTPDVVRATGSITLETCDQAEFAVIEYAFITEEVPGDGTTNNYFGTRFNDFFEVSITGEFEQEAGGDVFGRPVDIDAFVAHADSMNTLGKGAFNSKSPASTFCYSLSLNVARHRERDDITFGFSVADAVDDVFQSALCGRVFFVDAGGNRVCDTVSSK